MATEVPAHVSSAADMRTNLQALLDLKEKQLQQAGALGQRVLAQQVELEDRVRMLQEMELDRPDADEIDADMRERYRELAETVRAWDTENATLSSGFGSKVCTRTRCASRIGGTAILVMFDRLCVKRRARSILLRLKATEMTERPLRNIILALTHRCWF